MQENLMPSVSKKQQKFFGILHAYKAGTLDTSTLSPEFLAKIKKTAKGMPKKTVDEFAETKHKGLPEKVSMLKIASQKRLASLVTAYRSGKLDLSMITPALATKVRNATKGIKVTPSKDMAKRAEYFEKTASSKPNWYSWLEHDYFPMFGKYGNKIYEAQKKNRVPADWMEKRFKERDCDEPCVAEAPPVRSSRTSVMMTTINRLGK